MVQPGPLAAMLRNAGDIWKSTERLRGKFEAYEYWSVILPIIVIRRLECVPIDWRGKKAARARFATVEELGSQNPTSPFRCLRPSLSYMTATVKNRLAAMGGKRYSVDYPVFNAGRVA